MAPGTAQVEAEPREEAVGTAADYGDLDPVLRKKVAANSQKVSLASGDKLDMHNHHLHLVPGAHEREDV